MSVTALLKRCITVILVLAGTATFAATNPTDPVRMLQDVADKMVSQLSAKQSQLKSDPHVIRGIVEQVLIPYVDTSRMGGMVVGRNNWYSATPEQRREFIRQFKQVVISTYSDALASFDDDSVKVYPLRNSPAGKKYVQVKSAIIRKSGQKIVINYNLISSGNSWKIYDFSIEGVSIVQNYRSQFSSTLANGGMSSLIKQLQNYNRRR